MRRLLLVGLLPAFACVGPGLLTDGSSVSVGTHGGGVLRQGTVLPFQGDGYVVPPRWRERRRNYGTDEIVSLLVRAARRVQRQYRGSLLGIGDVGPRGGGPTPEHLSHRSGRDVDLIFYAVDDKGKPLPPVEMVHYDSTGSSLPALPTPVPIGTSDDPSATVPEPTVLQPRKLDLQRNWALLRALVTDPEARVQWVFVGRPIIQLLLQHARKAREPRWLVERAAQVMHQPGDAQNHMDHFHVRLLCDPGDLPLGCVNRGPARSLEQTTKYIEVPADRPIPLPLKNIGLAPLRFTLL